MSTYQCSVVKEHTVRGIGNCVYFVALIVAVKCMWPDTPANKRRRVFCSKYEGYKDLCHCSKPSAINEGVALVSKNLKIKHHFSLFLLAW